MLAPVNSYASLFTVLALPSYLPLLHAQSYPTRRSVANVVVHNILKNQTKIQTPEYAEGIFNLIRVLIREGQQQAAAGYPATQVRRSGRDLETDETMEEQGLLARMVHLLSSDNNEVQFKVFAHSITRWLFHNSPNAHSSCKLPRRLSTKAVTGFVTRRRRSSHNRSNWLVASSPANTTTTNGRPCPPRCTNSCTRAYPACMHA